VRTLERVGGQVDSALDAVSSLPVVPSYDSEDGLGATFGRLADTLEELPGQLDAIAGRLTDFTDNVGELQAELDRFADAVSTIAADLGDTDILVEQYRTSVADPGDERNPHIRGLGSSLGARSGGR